MAYPGGEHNEVNVNTFVVRVPSRQVGVAPLLMTINHWAGGGSVL